MTPPTEADGAGDPMATGRLTVRYRVRFDESGPDGMVRTSVLLRYAQDCAWRHSEHLGFGREWYAERDLAWLVRAVRLVLREAPPTGASLDVETRVIGFRRVMARRLTTMRTLDGRDVARIETDWVMTDARRGVPTRIPSDFPAMFMSAPGPFEPHRVPGDEEPGGPGDDLRQRRIEVQPYDLDPMGHANNGAYVDWLEACVLELPDGPARLAERPRTYLLEYLLPARPGAALTGLVWERGPGIRHRLLAGQDELLRARLDPGDPDGGAPHPQRSPILEP